jgi:hypothetical protein
MLAIRTSAANRYRSIVAQYTDQGREGKRMPCPECGEEYIVYFGAPVSDESATDQFNTHLRHEHSDGLKTHRDGFAVGSEFPSGAPGT